MSESKPDDQPDDAESGPTEEGHDVQQVRLQGVTARVPPAVGHGVFSTGAIVMNGPNEFVLDFVQQMGQQGHVVARVVLPHPVVPQFIRALEQNMERYEQSFGPPPALPKPQPGAKRPSIEEVYENLKLPDDELPGHYANGVLVRHSAAEFAFDFVANFFPHAAVSRRVFLSAPHVRPVLESLRNNLRQLQQNMQKRREQSPGEGPPPDVPPADEGS